MEDAGTVDLRARRDLPLALKVIGRPDATRRSTPRSRSCGRGWPRARHRSDRDSDGDYEHADAIRIMDAWWPLLAAAPSSSRALGPGAVRRRSPRMLALDNAPNNHGAHLGSAYQDGWYGYVSRTCGRSLGRKVQGRYSRGYCGGGMRTRCRMALLRARLKAALAVPGAQL